MAQISYGTITITDTNDIERIYPVYCRGGESSAPALLPLTNWKENISEITVSGDYIWQRIVTKKSGINVTQNDYSDAVRLTGEEGDAALNISEVEIQYGSSANWSTSPSNWGSNTPAYDNTKPYYWTRTRLKYENNTYSSWVTNKDYALTDAITKSVEANNNAAMANSIAQSANENAQGAMSQAVETQYQTEALAAKVKNYWWDSSGAHIASGINGADVTEGTASTYGFNSLVGLASMTFGYNSYKAVELDGGIPALKFYKPSKTSQGTQTATLDSNGLVLSEGGIQAGTAGQSGFIYLSTKNYGSNLTINGHQASNWREIIGTKFGVDADGNLYASNAEISGKITVSSGSDLSAGLSAYSTTAQTQSYVTGLGYQTSSQVNNIIEGKGYQTASDVNGAISTATSGLAAKTDAVYRTQRIYYRKTSSGAPGGNTTWLTSSGTGYGNWSLKIPQLTSGSTKYPYLYTAVQTQTISQYNSGATTNNCTCSTVLLDDSTTVIDGGTITTGKVGANYIDVDTLIANNSIVVGNDISDMATKTYVGSQGYQTANNVNNIISNTNVSSLKDGSSYATKTYAENEADAAQAAAELTAQGYANTAEANASYSIEVKVTAIDYTNSSATLVAVPYYQGSTTLPTLPNGGSYSYRWYKGTTALSNTSTSPTISGATTTTLVLGQGSDLEAIYVCVISKP